MQRSQDDAQPLIRPQKHITNRKIKQNALTDPNHPPLESQEIQRHPTSQSPSRPPNLLLLTKPPVITPQERNSSTHQIKSNRSEGQQLQIDPLKLLQQIQR